MAREIPLTKGKVAIVDDEDYERVIQFKWSAQGKEDGRFYAVRLEGPYKNRRWVPLHGFIMGITPPLEADHIDGDGLNCRRSNMRPATRSQNTANRKKGSSNTSGFKGVCFHRVTGRWIATITVNGSTTRLGYFRQKEDAAVAYDEAARKHFGEFARVNFPDDGERAA